VEAEERFEVSGCGVVAFGQNREGREASSYTNFCVSRPMTDDLRAVAILRSDLES
jgi:hypothetical protein